MKICLIVEGSYPYVTGGVSSWIQMLVSNMPNHEFIIYAISAKEDKNLSYKYAIPDNVIEINDIYLEINENNRFGSNKKVRLSESEKEVIYRFIIGEDFSWEEFFKCIDRLKRLNTVDILMSKDFYDIVEKAAINHYPYVVFNHLFWNIKSMFLTVLEVLKKDIPKADIYHSVSTGYAGLIGAMAKYNNRNSRFILTEHGIYTREREEEIIKADWVKGYFKDTWIKYFYNLSKAAYIYTDEVYTLFNKNKELQIELGCDSEKISIVPNGVKIENFNNLDNGKENDCIYIGAVVRIVPIKDIKTIISAFILANERIRNMKLYIMGPIDEDEDYYKECQELVSSSRNENIIFTGRVKVIDYIGKIDILLLGSISEGQPLAVLEGMAAKKPYITTDVGCCRELIYGNGDKLGSCGIVVPVMGDKKMADSIIKLSRDKLLRESMGKVGYKRVSKFYTEEMFIKNYIDIYEGKLGK